MDFYDGKGLVEALASGLHLPPPRYEPATHPAFHPGRCAEVFVAGRGLGILGELHPVVCERYGFVDTPLVAAELDLWAMLSERPAQRALQPVPAYPPVLEDLAFIVDEAVPAEQVTAEMRKAGGSLLAEIRLFDHYRGAPIEPGRKSLAYALTYQATDRTLTDLEVRRVRESLVAHLESSLGAKLRS